MQIKVDELNKADSNSWKKVKVEVDGLMDDINSELSLAWLISVDAGHYEMRRQTTDRYNYAHHLKDNDI
jgi:hypothetical protein